MTRAVTLLTLDAGSVLYDPTHMPDEIVLKHTDGELIKTKRSHRGDWLCQRREELDVNFWEDGKYSSPVTAVATLADRQAFGFRVDGEPVNPLAISHSSGTAETIELECLSLGGVVIEDEIQLPFAVYLPNEIYYRVFVSEDDDEDVNIPESTSVLEKREGPGGDWKELVRCEPTEAGCLVNTIAAETGMEATSGSANEIRDSIDDRQELFKASYSREDEELRERMAIQNNTAFPPSAPKPRPINFPN